MKINSLLLVIMTLLSIRAMAQEDITVDASYIPCDSTIVIHLVNNTDNQMRIFNNFGGGTSGSMIQFHLKDKAGKEISMYEAVFYEGVDYQRIVDINSHSTKTIKYPLKFLCPSSRNVSEIYSVDANYFIRYSIPEKNISAYLDKVLSIKTKLDTIIYRDENKQFIIGQSIKAMTQADIAVDAFYLPCDSTIVIHLGNNTDKLIRIRNDYGGTSSGSIIELHLKDKANKEISMYQAVFYEGVDYQHFVDINPHSTKTIKYPLKFFCPSSRSVSEIYSVDASCFIDYIIPEQEKIGSLHKILSIKTKQDLMIY